MIIAGQTVHNVVVDAFHVLAIEQECGFDHKVCKETGDVEMALVFHLVKGGVEEPANGAGIVCQRKVKSGMVATENLEP